MAQATTEILKQNKSKMAENAQGVENPTAPVRQQATASSLPVNGNISKAASSTRMKNSGLLLPQPPSLIQHEPTRTLNRTSPATENSILGTLKPRKRQPSILQELDLDSSTLNVEDGEGFFPDAESTPFHLSRAMNAGATTPPTSRSQGSALRKRKLGSAEPVPPARKTAGDEQEQIVSPLARAQVPRSGSTGPRLPLMPISTPRESGRKSPKHIQAEDDVMAPPQSSSSPSSPVTAGTQSSRESKARKPPPSMTTEQLQALMPTKRRRTARERTKATSTFDIPEDSDERDPATTQELSDDDGGDSSFLPTKRGKRMARKKPSMHPNPARLKVQVAGKSGSFKGKTASAATSISSTNLTTPLSRSARNRETKSPSQQPSIVASKSAAEDKPSSRRYGGSRPRTSTGTGDKENQWLDMSGGASDSEALDAGDVRQEKERPPKPYKDKWAEIDAWEMDFEDVDVATGSSSPLAR